VPSNQKRHDLIDSFVVTLVLIVLNNQFDHGIGLGLAGIREMLLQNVFCVKSSHRATNLLSQPRTKKRIMNMSGLWKMCEQCGNEGLTGRRVSKM
jgi:hypothetical protein